MSNIAKGFTIMEVLIAMGLLSLIIGVGLILSMDFYKTYAFAYEKDLIVGVLQKARSESMANVSKAEHGVFFSNEQHGYVILNEGNFTQFLEANKSIEINWPKEIIFNQLDGGCKTCGEKIEIELSGLGRTSTITVNHEGGIDY